MLTGKHQLGKFTMKSDNDRANNLVSRVFSYTPRPNRQPLEDFCTEILAWCLMNSRTFAKDFLDLTNIPGLKDCAEPISVHTQLAFDGESDGESSDEDEGEGALANSRYDLVILSKTSSRFVLIVECKVGAKFRPAQLPKYRDQLDKGSHFEDVAKGQRFLVALTAHGAAEKLDEAEGKLKWSAVRRLLQKSAKATAESDAKNAEIVKTVCQQFADFLKDNGMDLTLPKLDDTQIASHLDGLCFRENIENLLKRVRKENPKLKKLLENRVVYDQNDVLGETWLGLYNKKAHPFFYIGIQLADQKKPRYDMFVQAAWPQDPLQRKELSDAAQHDFESSFQPEDSYAIIREPIRPLYDGNAEAIIDRLGGAGVLLSRFMGLQA